MIDLVFDKSEKNKLIKRIEEVIIKLLNEDEDIVVNGVFTYIQNGKIIFKEGISQEKLKLHPFIESLHQDSNFRYSLINSKSTEIIYDNENSKEIFKIIVKEDNENEINITLAVSK